MSAAHGIVGPSNIPADRITDTRQAANRIIAEGHRGILDMGPVLRSRHRSFCQAPCMSRCDNNPTKTPSTAYKI